MGTSPLSSYHYLPHATTTPLTTFDDFLIPMTLIQSPISHVSDFSALGTYYAPAGIINVTLSEPTVFINHSPYYADHVPHPIRPVDLSILSGVGFPYTGDGYPTLFGPVPAASARFWPMDCSPVQETTATMTGSDLALNAVDPYGYFWFQISEQQMTPDIPDTVTHGGSPSSAITGLSTPRSTQSGHWASNNPFRPEAGFISLASPAITRITTAVDRIVPRNDAVVYPQEPPPAYGTESYEWKRTSADPLPRPDTVPQQSGNGNRQDWQETSSNNATRRDIHHAVSMSTLLSLHGVTPPLSLGYSPSEQYSLAASRSPRNGKMSRIAKSVKSTIGNWQHKVKSAVRSRSSRLLSFVKSSIAYETGTDQWYDGDYQETERTVAVDAENGIERPAPPYTRAGDDRTASLQVTNGSLVRLRWDNQ
jgi:hypothetical protein